MNEKSAGFYPALFSEFFGHASPMLSLFIITRVLRNSSLQERESVQQIDKVTQIASQENITCLATSLRLCTHASRV